MKTIEHELSVLVDTEKGGLVTREYKIEAQEFSAFVAAALQVECERVVGRPRIRINAMGDVTFIFDFVPPGEAMAVATTRPLDGPNPAATKEHKLATGGKY